MRKTTALGLAMVFGFTLLCASGAGAVPVTWTLYGVTFEDGGVATGTFTLDVDQGLATALQSWSLSVSGGNTSFNPPATFDSSLPDHSASVDDGSRAPDGQAFIFEFDLADPMPPGKTVRQLRLDPIVPLTNAGGTVFLDLDNPDRNVDCFNCGFARLINGGFVSTVPEPAPLTLAVAACVSWLGVRRGRHAG